MGTVSASVFVVIIMQLISSVSSRNSYRILIGMATVAIQVMTYLIISYYIISYYVLKIPYNVYHMPLTIYYDIRRYNMIYTTL
jgi:hypothetical protein